jgi:hypothetical protein
MIQKLLTLPMGELKKGYGYDVENRCYVCHVCGKKYDDSEQYDTDGSVYDADEMMDIHIRKEHGGMLNVLTSIDKKYTGLTESQKEILQMMVEGLSDKEMAKKTGVEPVTVRHKRFIFKEKAKQAKLYLAIYETVTEQYEKNKNNKQDKLIEVPSGATIPKDMYLITEEERDKILALVFYSLDPLRLKNFSAKAKRKFVILQKIAEQFEPGKIYTEKEVNAVLKDIYDDYVTIRRYLIDYGFMERTRDCREYWLKS